MYKKLCENRGAVAVFLVIVLVPMITIASLFVEAARVKMAQALVSSAGDLALNTLMTQYDYDLNDYYGMVASAQDVSDLQAKVSDYFQACFVSQGVDTTYARKYANMIKSLFSPDDSIDDLMKISVDGDITIGKTTGGDLTNPALIKTQIVDFMKYRSPINAAAELLEALMNVGKEVETLPDQSDALDKQEQFYDEEQKLFQLAKDTYDAINDYSELNINRSYIEGLKESTSAYEDEYHRIHNKMIFDLFGTENVTAFTAAALHIDEAYYKNKTNNSLPYSESSPASRSNVVQKMTAVADAIETILPLLRTFKAKETRIPYQSSVHYSTRYYINMWSELVSPGTYSRLVSAIGSLMKNAQQMINAYENAAEGAAESELNLRGRTGVNASGEKTVAEHYSSLKSQYNTIFANEIKNDKCQIVAFGNRMQGISSTIFSDTGGDIPRTTTELPDRVIKRDSSNSRIRRIHQEINGFYEKITDGISRLTTAVEKARLVKNEIPTYNNSFSSWKTAATKSSLDGTQYAESAREDINKREGGRVEQRVQAVLTEANVQALINRLNNIKSALGEIKAYLENIKYNGTSIKDIPDLKTLENKSGAQLSELSLVINELWSLANRTFKFDMPTLTLGITDNNNPKITENKPTVYEWMQEYFVAKVNTDMSESEGKGKKDEYKKSAEEKIGADKDESVQLGGSDPEYSAWGGTLPSAGGGTDGLKQKKTSVLSQVTNFVKELVGDIGGTLKNAGKAVRDDLYTVDYIMSMFSFDTYENEGKLSLLLEKEPNTKLNLAINYSSVNDAWKSQEKTDPYNKSLTNKMINSANCYSYGNEAEYILYGKSNQENKNSAYGTIFMIRYALNIGPIFSRFFNDRIVVSLGAAVQAATLGVVPSTLIQLAICLLLTAGEAASDIAYLKKGIGVKLVKSKQDLFMNISESGSISDGENNNAVGEKLPCFQYSDYLKLLLFVSLLNSNKSNSIYLRIADVVQTNMGKVTKKSTDYSLSNSVVYYSLSADIKVTPILIGLPLIESNIGGEVTGRAYENFSASKWNIFKYEITRGY